MTLAPAHRRGEAFAYHAHCDVVSTGQMLRPYPCGYEPCPNVVHFGLVYRE